MRIAAFSLIVLFSLTIAVSSSAQDRRITTKSKATATKIDKKAAAKLNALKASARKLKTLAGEPMPEGLTREQQAAWKDYQTFLKDSARTIQNRIAEAGDASSDEVDDIGQQLQLQLQDALQRQQKTVQVLSNIMKSQHDTAKSIIGNMR